MILGIAGAMLVAYYATERGVALWRRVKIDQRRAKAEFPITGNDPVGRIIV